MSSKRVKAKEEKRRRKQQKTLIIAGLAAAAVLIVVAFTLYGLDRYAKSYVITFEGQKVSTNDFLFFGLFAEETEEMSAKDSALDQLLSFLTLEKAAKDNGLALTEDEQAEALTYAESFKSYYEQNYGLNLSFVTNERLSEFLGQDSLYEQLRDIYTVSFVLDEDAFDAALDDYIENDQLDYYDMQMRYIYTSDQETIETARQAIADGMDFDEAIIQYSEYYSEESGISPYPLKYMGLEEEDANRMLALQEGELSDIVETNGMYALFYVDSLTVPTVREVAETYRESYILDKKNEMFLEILEGWKKEANYTINEKGYNAA